MSNELATIEEYAPPYWDERAWDLTDREPWEQWGLAALKMGHATALEGLVSDLEEDDTWAKPVSLGHSRHAAVFYFNSDIIGASTPQLKEMRKSRAARFTRFTVEPTNEMLGLMENWEEAMIKWLDDRHEDAQETHEWPLVP